MVPQLQIWRYGLSAPVQVGSHQLTDYLAGIANDVLYMVGLDGGLIPDDGDSDRMFSLLSIQQMVSHRF